MIDLKQQVNEIIDQECESEYNQLVEHVCATYDWATYYEHDLKKFFAENEISLAMIEWLLEHIDCWVDGKDILQRSDGYFGYSSEFSIIHIDELEINMSWYFGDRDKQTIKESVRRAICQNTDLYIPENSVYGYYTGFGMISVVINAPMLKKWVRNNQDVIAQLS